MSSHRRSGFTFALICFVYLKVFYTMNSAILTFFRGDLPEKLWLKGSLASILTGLYITIFSGYLKIRQWYMPTICTFIGFANHLLFGRYSGFYALTFLHLALGTLATFFFGAIINIIKVKKEQKGKQLHYNKVGYYFLLTIFLAVSIILISVSIYDFLLIFQAS